MIPTETERFQKMNCHGADQPDDAVSKGAADAAGAAGHGDDDALAKRNTLLSGQHISPC